LTNLSRYDKVRLSALRAKDMVKIKAAVEIEDLYDVDATADLLGMGVATIWRRIRNGEIIKVRIAGRTLIPKSEIERIKNEQAAEEARAPSQRNEGNVTRHEDKESHLFQMRDEDCSSRL